MGPLEKPRQELLSELSAAPPSSGGSSKDAVVPPQVIGALISAAASIGSNIYSNYRNRQLAEQQNQWNLEQWNRENRYNDPSNQIERLRRAGINPALAYANGDLMNEAAASPQMTSALGHITSPVQIDPLMGAQIANLNAQTESIQHQTSREDEKQPVVMEQLNQTLENTRQELKNMVEQLRGIRTDNDRKSAELSILDSTMNYIVAQRKYEALMSQDQYSVFLRGLLADIGVKEAEAPYKKSLTLLSDKQREQVEFLLTTGREYFDAEKPYLNANAHNEYVSLYWSARKIRLATQIFDKYKDADWWIKTVGGTLIDAGEAVGHGFGSGLRGKSSRGSAPGPGRISYSY